MKIGINGRAFDTEQPGGSVGTAIEHTKRLCNIGRAQTVLYANRSAEEKFSDEMCINSKYLPTKSTAFGLLWERTVLPFVGKLDNLDILYCPNANAPVHETGKFKTVVTIHHVMPEMGQSKVERLYRKTILPRTASSADAVVTVSEFSKNQISSRLDIPRRKIHVVPNGIKTLFLSDRPGSVLDLPEDYILYVGALSERKNISRLIKSFEEAKNKYDFPHKLVLIGPSEKLLYESVNLNKSPDIVIPGYVNDYELKYAYKNAELFVFPSLYEGFGLPPLEAMACGTPVVASNTTALPEVLDNAAEFVNPHSTQSIAEGLATVNNKQRLAKLSKLGKQRANNYTWDRSGQDLYNLFQNLCR